MRLMVGSIVRSVVCGALCLGPVTGFAQVWEKWVGPGMIYRMEYDSSIPRVIHAIRYTPGSPFVKPMAELAELKVYSEGDTKGREALSALVQRSGAIGGVNADFFPFTGDPLGAMVRAGELISPPYPNRAVFGWGPAVSAVGRLRWKATLYPDGGEKLEIDSMNEEWGQDGLVLNTEVAGYSIAKEPNVHVVVKLDETRIGPSGKITAVVERTELDKEQVVVEQGKAVLLARGPKAERILQLQPGQKVTFDVATLGFDWAKVDQVVGGGPFLVVNNKPYIDWKQAGFKENFAEKRHPRTAVGKTASGDVWFVIVDGRQDMSDGATLAELADVMVGLGCTDAINLDGGGSSTMNLFGMTLNRPSDGKERPISNAVLFAGAIPTIETEPMAIKGPARIGPGARATYEVIGPDGRPVPQSSVIWSASGGAWVDQGGMLRAIGNSTGAATLQAWARGQLLTIPITIAPAAGN